MLAWTEWAVSNEIPIYLYVPSFVAICFNRGDPSQNQYLYISLTQGSSVNHNNPYANGTRHMWILWTANFSRFLQHQRIFCWAHSQLSSGYWLFIKQLVFYTWNANSVCQNIYLKLKWQINGWPFAKQWTRRDGKNAHTNNETLIAGNFMHSDVY